MPDNISRTAADALSLFAEIPCCRRGRVRLGSRIRHALRLTESSVRVGKEIERRGVSSTAFEWLCDNAALIGMTAHSLLREKPPKDVQLDENGLPRMLSVFAAFLDTRDSPPDTDTFAAFLSCTEADGTLRFSDFEALPYLFSAACVLAVGNVCQRLGDGELFDADRAASRLSVIIPTLHDLAGCPFEAAFSHCAAEKALMRDPSGVYADQTDETKQYYRRLVSQTAKRRGISEVSLVEELLVRAQSGKDERTRHIGAYLVPPKDGFRVTLFRFLTLTLACVPLGVLAMFSPVLFIAAPVLYEAARMIAARIMAHVCRRDQSVLPALALKEIPDTDAVLVVITTLLCGKKADAEVFDRLERLHASCGGKNICFGILGDLPDAPHAVMPHDEEAVTNAISRIAALNRRYGAPFFLFVRDRTRAAGEKSFMGYERKRGAVCALVKYLCGTDNAFSKDAMLPDAPLCRKIRYVVTLDADTELPPDAVRVMAGKMLHPLNRPVIDRFRHTVTKGYGILQPRVSTAVGAASRSLFSALHTAPGGCEPYPSDFFDIEDALCGTASFCGKGMFDKYAFAETILHPDIAFPENTVLSHDVLEGERLRCAREKDVEMTDGFPKNELSYHKRHHRWVRGDVQNLLFAGSRVPTQNGTFAAPFPAHSRLKLLDTVRRETVPVFSLLLLAVCTTLDGTAFALGVTAALLPYLLPVVLSLRSVRYMFRRFFASGVLSGFLQTLTRALYEISSLVKTASVTLDAFLRSLVRIRITHRRCLEWVTAAQSDADAADGLLAFVRKNLISALAGAAFYVFAPQTVLKLLGVLFFVFPAAAYLLGKPCGSEERVSERDKETLRSYAADTWRYFEQTVGADDHFLPPDNVQFYPTERIAHRTSPTNIGLYLLCILAARDLRLIDTEMLYARALNTLETIEKLPKWRGHLYNWYDTVTLDVLAPNYVSSVDSGNLLACLIAFAEGLKNYASEKAALVLLARRCTEIVKQTDIASLYDDARELFTLGVTVDADGTAHDGGIRYDLLMSESRLLSYVAVALRAVPVRHWRRLSRTVIGRHGHIGLASWTGTAFEYAMPALVLPTVKNSLCSEALRFAVREQKKRRAHFGNTSVTGISESAFHAFDADGSYRYFAFGVPSLALRRGQERDLVIAPYASFLFLPFDPAGSVDNLRHLKDGGAYGSFGFYDAVDCTPSRTPSGGTVVRTVMAHHAGMSLVACANACKNDVFVRRFMKNASMRGAYELLCERIPADAPVLKKRRLAVHDERPERFKGHTESRRIAAVSLGDGHVRLLAAKDTVMLYAGRVCLTRDHSFDVSVGTREHLLSSSFPYDDGGAARFEKDGVNVSLAPVYGGSAFAVKITCREDSEPVTLRFVPTLMEENAYEAHSAFHDLFLTSRYDASASALFFTRHIRTPSEHPVCLCVGTDAADFSYAVRRQDGTLSSDGDGACIRPHCRISFTPGKDGEGCVYLGVGRDEKKALEAMTNARRRGFESIKAMSAGLEASSKPPVEYEALTDACMTRMASSLAAPPSRRVPFGTRFPVGRLWSYGISGDLPIFLLKVSTAAGVPRLAPVLYAYRRLTLQGVRCDLVLLCLDTERYGAPIAARTRELLAECGVPAYVGRRGGGIFLPAADADTVTLFEAICTDVPNEPLLPPSDACTALTVAAAPQDTACPAASVLECGIGFFTSDGYVCRRGTSHQGTPFAAVLAGYAFGSVMTQDSLGFSFSGNAALRRITAFSDHPDGERLYLRDGDTLFDLAACASFFYVLPGETRYIGRVCGIGYTLSVTVAASLSVKQTEVRVSEPCDLLYAIRPSFGGSEGTNRRVGVRVRAGAAEFAPVMSDAFEGETGFVFCRGASYSFPEGGILGGFVCADVRCDARTVFALGTFRSEKTRTYLLDVMETGTPKQSAYAFASRFKPCASLSGKGDAMTALAMLFNTFLPYQTGMCRMYARSGPSQAGGAYGYRDQLQDVLCLMYADRRASRTHLIRAASHTLEDGSALHWWHPSFDGRDTGIRSVISDDYLFLPYCTAKYVQYTGDTSVFGAVCPIRTGEALENGQTERYIETRKSGEKRSVNDICVSALRRGFSLVGAHGLPLLGGGDWCDGLNAAGVGMKGESVWLGQFLVVTARTYLAAASSLLDAETVRELQGKAAAMTEALEKYAYEADGARYLRAWYDDGTPLGSVHGEEGSLELLPQAFAVFSGVPTDRARTVMRTAYDGLYDRKTKLFRLFAPPYDKTGKNPGYIKSYVPGVRENGGQYTHAAVWGAMAMIRAALGKEGETVDEDLLRKGTSAMIDLYPSVRCLDKCLASSYGAEPYVCTADIYTNEAAYGKGGWSWYTGSAGWLWTATLGGLFGIHLYDVTVPGRSRIVFTKAAHFAPFADDRLQSPVLTLRFKNARYRVCYDASAHGITLDGRSASDTVPVTSGEHTVVVGRENGSA